MKTKTRVAYGTSKATGEVFYLGDTVKAALDCNEMVRDYEKKLIANNQDLEITIKIERA